MVYLEINKKNYDNGNPSLIDKLNAHLSNKDDKLFVLFFMEGCGPCNATRPEWSKLKNVLSNDFLNKEDIVIVSIDKDLVGKLKNIVSEPNSFPTMRFITNQGKESENYEDADIDRKDRTIDSFIEWIKYKTGEENISNSENKLSKQGGKRKTRKNRNKNKRSHKIANKTKKYGGKWSSKYKRSINCNHPKGFSQRQYCKYGRKK